jgi:L-asparaginase
MAPVVKVLLVHTGGTLMMRSGTSSPLEPSEYARDLVAEVPVLAKIAEVDTRILFQLDSSDMEPRHWIAIAETIHEALPRYDGVVVVHGTDTMAYSASALSFLLPDLDRPVILTGSQRPLDQIRSDARQNLVDAFELATLPIPEVGLAFASKLLRGCRATKHNAWGFDAFLSPNCPPLATLGVSIERGDHVLAPRPRQSFDGRLEPRVLAVRLFPGFDPQLLRAALASGVRGLLVKAYGAGNVPAKDRTLVAAIAEATARDVPVVIVSQCLYAHVDLSRYAGSAAAEKAGAIGAGDMTDEAALTKLMISLGRAGDSGRVAAVRSAFERSRVGEMSPPSLLERDAGLTSGW